MRTLHVVSLPHTTLTEKHATCAYSMKVLKFVKMMRSEGARVVLYGPDEIECEPDEHVVITTQADRERWGFGEGFDTALTPFLWDASQPYWFEANTRAIDALRERVSKYDYLCLIAGWAQQPIAHAVAGAAYNNPITVEWGVGYEGIFTTLCAFESYSWMHHVYGLQKHVNGRAFDQVIPNFFDTAQFRMARKPDGDYLLYIGRLVHRKGPHIALEIAKKMGMKLKVAGPGATEWSSKKIVAPEVTLEGDVEYLGTVGFEERSELMANAAAILVPTLYIEPFGGVAVEAMLTGTPVVASDWGSFTEIVTPGVGARFRTLRQGVAAVKSVQFLDRKQIRAHAIAHYSLQAVGQMFTRWFDQLDTLWGSGWYE
jgi:glycosyltransferase involved in cell wall biosynthesis